MPTSRSGRCVPIGEDRSFVFDVLHYSRRMPMHPAERLCDLGRVASLRLAVSPRVSWSVVFLKAYALLSQRQPALRRAFLRWPWPHFYEHGQSVAMLTISREYRDKDRLFAGRFTNPEERSLVDLQHRLERYQHEEVEKVFLRQLRLSRLPTPVRRALWWCNLCLHGPTRATRMGTFSASTLAGQQTLNRWHPSVLTSSVTWGPLDATGRALVTIIYDHRVMDGLEAARGLIRLEEILNGEIATELEGLCSQPRILPFAGHRPGRRAA